MCRSVEHSSTWSCTCLNWEPFISLRIRQDFKGESSYRRSLFMLSSRLLVYRKMQQHSSNYVFSCADLCISFLCEWLLQLTIHIFFQSKVTAELFSERQNASSSTCTLWVTVSISTICRLVSPYTLHCVVPLSCLDSATCIAVYFLSVRPFLLFFLHAPPCVKSVTSLRAGAKPDMPLLPR